MLDLFGRGYVIEHCVSTFNAMQKEDIYKAYESEILRSIANQLGVEIKMNYFDVVDLMKPHEEDNRTASDIISDLKSKASSLNGE